MQYLLYHLPFTDTPAVLVKILSQYLFDIYVIRVFLLGQPSVLPIQWRSLITCLPMVSTAVGLQIFVLKYRRYGEETRFNTEIIVENAFPY